MEILVLGSMELREDRRRVGIGAAKQRALLACLVLSINQIVRRDWLIEELWPGSPAESAKASLQSCIYRLRKLLTGSGTETAGVVLRTKEAGYTLEASPDLVDLYRFQSFVKQANASVAGGAPDAAVSSLRDGLALWRGNAFADVELESIRNAADALEDQRLDAIELCLTAELELGRHAEVITELETLVAEQPLRERGWGLLMTALYRCGRQGDALRAYTDLRALLGDRLGIEPARDLRDLHQRILDNDPALTPKSYMTGAAVLASSATAPQHAPPRQLPPDIAPFAGRDSDLAFLDALLPDDDRGHYRPTVITAVDGTAGIGKTALAIHWAHRVEEQFPDGQLYLNLRGYGPTGAMDPVDAAEAMLRSLGVPTDQIPAGLDSRSALLRTLLAGKRMLVLLDNARDANQVRPLLPGAGSMVVITSRSQLRGLVAREGAHRLTLGHFTERESIDLLTRIIGERARSEPGAARELARLCCGLPLALALAAERATREQAIRLAELIDDLYDERERLDALGSDEDSSSDLRGVFAWSYRSLSVEAARLFRLLGIAPGPDIGVPAAAALAGIGHSRTQRLLDHLAQANLVQCRQKGRFEIHDLLRTYVIELAHEHDPAGQRNVAIHRLLFWYTHTAFNARSLLQPSETTVNPEAMADQLVPLAFRTAPDALTWYGVERHNLVAAIRLAHDDRYDDLCWRLAFALWVHSHITGAFDSILELHGFGLQAARRLGSPVAEAHMLTGIGPAHRAQGRLETAVQLQLEALALFRTAGDRAGEANALNNLSVAYRDLGRYEESLAYGRQTYALDRLHQQAGNMSMSLYQIARALNAMGRHHSAIEAATRSLKLARQLDHRRGAAIALQVLATASLELHEYEAAVEYGWEVVRIFADLGARTQHATALSFYGDALDAAGRPDAAKAAWTQAQAVLREIGAPDVDAVPAGTSS